MIASPLQAARSLAADVHAATERGRRLAAGGSSIYTTSPLQRAFRDVHVATQHVMVRTMIQELCGKVLAGLETDTSML